jgi:hypothetical protein
MRLRDPTPELSRTVEMVSRPQQISAECHKCEGNREKRHNASPLSDPPAHEATPSPKPVDVHHVKFCSTLWFISSGAEEGRTEELHQ